MDAKWVQSFFIVSALGKFNIQICGRYEVDGLSQWLAMNLRTSAVRS